MSIDVWKVPGILQDLLDLCQPIIGKHVTVISQFEQAAIHYKQYIILHIYDIFCVVKTHLLFKYPLI